MYAGANIPSLSLSIYYVATRARAFIRPALEIRENGPAYISCARARLPSPVDLRSRALASIWSSFREYWYERVFRVFGQISFYAIFGAMVVLDIL